MTASSLESVDDESGFYLIPVNPEFTQKLKRVKLPHIVSGFLCFSDVQDLFRDRRRGFSVHRHCSFKQIDNGGIFLREVAPNRKPLLRRKLGFFVLQFADAGASADP